MKNFYLKSRISICVVLCLLSFTFFSFISSAQPVNDLCGDAISIDCGDIASGTTSGSIFDNVGFCGTANTTGGVWYTFTGNGDRVVLSTCSAETNYDSKLSVFEGSCNGLVCVAGNDDLAVLILTCMQQ